MFRSCPQILRLLAWRTPCEEFSAGPATEWRRSSPIPRMHHAQSTKGLQGTPIAIDGLWSLRVGGADNGKNGYANALYFTAGPNGEQDGLFGALTPDGLYGTAPYPFPGP